MDSSLGLVSAIAREWTKQAARWSCLHGIESYPLGLGRDLDVMVDRQDISTCLTLARQELFQRGYRAARPVDSWGKRLIAFRDEDWNSGVELHLVDRVQWRGCDLALEVRPDCAIGVFAIDSWAYFAKTVLLTLFSHQTHKASQRYLQLKSDSPVRLDRIREELGRLSTPDRGDRLLSALENSDVEAIAESGRALKASMLRKSLVRNPHRYGRNLSRLALQRYAGFKHPAGPLVLLVGLSAAESHRVVEYLRAHPSLLLNTHSLPIGVPATRGHGIGAKARQAIQVGGQRSRQMIVLLEATPQDSDGLKRLLAKADLIISRKEHQEAVRRLQRTLATEVLVLSSSLEDEIGPALTRAMLQLGRAQYVKGSSDVS
jgi:hypothetical protein